MTAQQEKIKRITEVTACRKCGCTEVRETRRWDQHSNGHWNESVKFRCGAVYEFSPNFMEVGVTTECKDNPEFKARQKLVDSVRTEIFELGEKRGLHPDDMKQLQSSLQYWKLHGSW